MMYLSQWAVIDSQLASGYHFSPSPVGEVRPEQYYSPFPATPTSLTRLHVNPSRSSKSPKGHGLAASTFPSRPSSSQPKMAFACLFKRVVL